MDGNDQRGMVRQGTEFATRPEVIAAFGDVLRDEGAWRSANRDADRFFAERGISPPDGVGIRPIPWPDFGRPSPEWEPFTIRMTMCTKVWVSDEGGLPHEDQVCRGFEVVSHPIPGGPRG